MNIPEKDIRTAALLGGDACNKLKNSKVAVFGLGGVGGHLCEALARAGIGRLDLYDGDTVNESNLNRQTVALRSTLGRNKTEVMRERVLDINPDCEVRIFTVFYTPENADGFALDGCDYIADAIDTVAAKTELAVRANRLNIPIISAMGAGNKLCPTAFEVADIYSTQVCPLAKAMRHELKSRGVTAVKTVFSREPARKNDAGVIGSVSFVPSVVGLIMAGEIVCDIVGVKKNIK